MTWLPLIALSALLLVPGPALGHAQFVSSSPSANAILPEPPSLVVVALSETIEPSTARINVTNATGAAFAVEGTTVSTTDPRRMEARLTSVGPCVYTVRWSATSAIDGHHSDGAFAFSVQQPDGSLCGAINVTATANAPPVSPVEVALRFAAFATLAATVGAIGVAVLALEPAVRNLKGASRSAGVGALRLLVRWAGAQAAAFCAFAAAWAAFSIINAPEGVSSSFVQSLAARSALGGGMAAVLLLSNRLSSGFTDESRRRTLLAAAAGLAAGTIALAAMSSHAAASVPWKPLAAAFDFVHLGGALYWAGSLFALLLLRRDLQATPRLARGVLSRFARAAFYAVGAVLLGGLLLAVVQLGSVGALFTSTYGLLVLAMALLFVPMAALGAHNHYWSIPALRETGEVAEKALRKIVANVRIETAAGIAVLVVASLLTAIPPAAPAPAPPGSLILEDRDGGLRVVFESTPYPGPLGNYSFQFQLYNVSSGFPDNSTTNATMTVRLLDSTLTPDTFTLAGPHGNHYFTDPTEGPVPNFVQAGTYRIDVDFIRPGHLDVIVTYNIVITGATA